jgi:ADP-heptose:LPS heptosyltransferase
MLPQVPANRPSKPLGDRDVRSVLLVRLRVGLGDLLCTVPAVRALRAARPDLHVALTTWPEMAGVVGRMSDWIDELVPFPGAPGIPERPPDGTLDAWATQVAQRGFDLALQVYGDNPAANEVTRRTGARVVGGFAPTRGALQLDPALHLPYPHALHEADRHLRLLEHLGLPPGADRSLAWTVTEQDERGLADLLAATGLRRGGYVVLHPGATSASRRWPVERFAAVGNALASDGLQVAVGGVSSEGATTAAVLGAVRCDAVDLTARTTLGEYAALLRDAAVVVANDTGTAHLSAAVGGRVVTVFLSGDPVRWRHPADLQRVVRQDVGCNPCPHLACPIDFRCATRISAEQVVAAARAMLRKPPTPAPPSARR